MSLRSKITVIEVLILVMIVGALLMIVVGAKNDVSAKEEFMTECMQDLKKYECTVMWNESKPRTNTVVMPIPMSTP